MNSKFKKISRVLCLLLILSIGFSFTAEASIAEVKSQDPYKRLLQMVDEDKELVETEEIRDENKEVLYIVEIDELAIKDYAGEEDIEKYSNDEKLRKTILDSQKRYRDDILKIYSKAEFKNEYIVLLNGFSVIAREKDMEAIKNIKGVKHISISEEYQRDMRHAIDLGKTKEIYESFGYKGEGMVVSVIDSGVDYNHKDMVLSTKGSKEKKLSELDINTMIRNKGFNGKYFTEKVPYGCNYIDNDKHSIIDTAIGNVGYMHGMHVAGIIAGNCQNPKDVESGNGIVGVAPEAQILAMKVFSNDPQMNNATEADIISAIEDSVALGADVINMSISGSAGFQNPEDGQQKAIRQAMERGVIVIVAGGNAYYSTYPNKYRDVIDTSTIGAPGITEDCLQVASMDNIKSTHFLMEYSIEGKSQFIPYSMTDFDIKSLKDEYKVVDCGLGLKAEDFPNDIRGNIALIQRGEGDFSAKKINAQNKGAKAVIIYNYDGDEGLLGATAYDKEVLLPSIFIKYSDGIKLKNGIGKGMKVSFPDKVLELDGEDKMSDFSSWGPAPNLNLKPDITGVGGNIWSTVNYNSYRSMSGTSMATPYVAGMSALMKQHYKRLKLNLEGGDFVNYNKINLMNTATIIEKNNLPISPRKQGAGLISGENAVKNSVLLTHNNKGSISLKEIGIYNEFKIKLKNYGEKSLEFDIVGSPILTDVEREEKELSVVESKESNISFNKNNIKLMPNEEKEVIVKLNVDKNLPINKFIEGFIQFKSKDMGNSDLSIPYLGFYGKWDSFKNTDETIFSKKSLINKTTLVSMNQSAFGNEVFYIGQGKDSDSKYFAINPKGDYSIKNAVPQVTLFRNLKEINIDIIDENEKVIRSLGKQQNIKKNVFPEELFHGQVDQSWIWDGKSYNKDKGMLEIVEDGQYYIDFKSKIDFENANEQVLRFPIKIDSKVPEFNVPNIVFVDSDNIDLSIEANDREGSGISGFVFIVDEKEYKNHKGNSIFDLKENNGKYNVNLELPKGDRIVYNGYFGCLDYAKNLSHRETVIIDKRKSNLDIKFDKDEYEIGDDINLSFKTDRDVDYYEITVNGNTVNSIKTKKNTVKLNGSGLREINSVVVKAMDKKGSIVDGNAKEFEVLQKVNAEKELVIRDISNRDYFYKGEYAPIKIKVANLSDNKKDITLLVNLYDSKNNLISVASSMDVLDKDDESILEAGMVIPMEGNYRLEVSIWDNLDNQKPYVENIVKPIG